MTQFAQCWSVELNKAIEEFLKKETKGGLGWGFVVGSPPEWNSSRRPFGGENLPNGVGGASVYASLISSVSFC